jgi:hydrogenase maturation protease
VSLLDPPEELRGAASACKNVGNFPVLVGAEGERDMMLCSPIILYDYPQIAPESAGNFYDATEMDEMLTLRVMTLTEPEKEQMRSAGEQVRALLERTERTAREQLMKTHGTIRSLRPVSETQNQQPNSWMNER